MRQNGLTKPQMREGQPRDGALWARIEGGIRENRERRRNRLTCVAAMLACLLVALVALLHLVPLLPRQRAVVMTAPARAAEADGLATLSLAHVDVRVTSALFDGRTLRVEYSVRDRAATGRLSEAEQALPVITAGAADGLTACGWLEIDGQEASLSQRSSAPGELPGEMRYTVSTIPVEHGISIGETVEVGLPILKESGERQTVPDALRLSIEPRMPLWMVEEAVPAERRILGRRVALESASFTPLGGEIALRFEGRHDVVDPYATRWSGAQLYDEEGALLGYVSIDGWDYGDPRCVRVRYAVSPPEKWPNRMRLAIPQKDGAADPTQWMDIVLAEDTPARAAQRDAPPGQVL